jgi:predicted metal-dependent HD superfamily phosphohydrolase
MAKQANDVGLIWFNVDPLYGNIRDYINTHTDSRNPDFDGAEIHIRALLESKMPNLPYHNLNHIQDVVSTSEMIAQLENASLEEGRLVRLAAWYHDAGFIQSPKNHEEHGANLARETLPQFGFHDDLIKAIENMILATRLPQTPTTQLENILCDADLDYLGRDDFYETGEKLFKEMLEQGAVENEREWNLVQRTFLQSHRYHTNYSKANRESSKQERLQEIAMKLKNRTG